MSELLEINHLSFTIDETGKLIPSSQITYTWKFYLDQQYRIIKLIHSKIKGKRKVFFNDLLLCIYRKYTFNFKYEFLCDKHLININQIGRNYYNLTIDGISFKKLENIQKLNRYNIIRDEYIKENPLNLTKSVKELMKEEEEEKNNRKKKEENEIVEFMNKKYKNFEENIEEEDEKENDFEEKNYEINNNKNNIINFTDNNNNNNNEEDENSNNNSEKTEDKIIINSSNNDLNINENKIIDKILEHMNKNKENKKIIKLNE